MGELSRKPKKGAAKVRHLGRTKSQITRYYEKTYPERKLRHILKNNGINEAKSWAAKRGIMSILRHVAAQLGMEI
jgi:hypothetical protein